VFLRNQHFIRQNTAATLAHRMQYLGEPMHKAAKWVVEALHKEHGAGGVIALDNEGNGEQLAAILKWRRPATDGRSRNAPELSRHVSRVGSRGRGAEDCYFR
jgi:isoaspartyl peptidase/L-asparaginase-like protein (Ntn-hydrolase superfamily)